MVSDCCREGLKVCLGSLVGLIEGHRLSQGLPGGLEPGQDYTMTILLGEETLQVQVALRQSGFLAAQRNVVMTQLGTAVPAFPATAVMAEDVSRLERWPTFWTAS